MLDRPPGGEPAVSQSGTAVNAAHVELNALLARYADAVMRRDPDDWIATWAPDATWYLAGHEVTGRDAILATWQGAMAGFPLVIHTVHTPHVVIGDGVARGRCTVEEILQTADGGARQVFGVYHDEFTRAGEAWLFQRRRFDVLLARPIDLSAADVIPWPADVDPDFLR
jgi:ketosteroid isomerase-like protein